MSDSEFNTARGASVSSAEREATSLPSSAGDISELIRKVALQDRAAFARLYEATAAKLLGTVLRILHQRGWAEDVVQDAYLKIWQKAGQFEANKASPITWMVTIARNTAIDELRRQPAARPAPTDEFDQMAAPGPGAQTRLEDQQALDRLNGCLDQLEKERREMVRLAYLNGWSRAELGAHFDQPVNTVKTWLHRALKQLKGCLTP